MERREFNSRGQFTVLRPFRFAGRNLAQGDLFPHRALACDSRRLRILWEAKKIEMLDPFSDAAAAAQKEESRLADMAELEALAAELEDEADELVDEGDDLED